MWIEEMSKSYSYRLNGLDCWREVILERALSTWFPEDPETVQMLCKDHRRQQEAVEHTRKDMLNRGYELLTCMEKYEGQIIQRPKSKNEWEEEVGSGEAVAFYFEPSKGTDRGKSLLAFTRVSLLKLLYRVGFDDELLDGFLKKCTGSGILCDENRKIRVGKDTIDSITFYREKF